MAGTCSLEKPAAVLPGSVSRVLVLELEPVNLNFMTDPFAGEHPGIGEDIEGCFFLVGGEDEETWVLVRGYRETAQDGCYEGDLLFVPSTFDVGNIGFETLRILFVI